MSEEVVLRQTGAGRLDRDPPLAKWFVALSHDSPLEQPQAGAAGGAIAPPLAAVPSLLSLLKDADAHVRLRTIMAVGDLAGELRRVLPALRTALEEAALHDGDDSIRGEATQALLRAGPQPVTEVAALVDALHSKLDVVRFHAAIALGDLGRAGQPAVPALIHASLWDEEPAVRIGAAMALWKIDQNGPLVVGVLVRALDDDNELICWVAAEYLGQMGPAAREAIPALQRALHRSYRLSVVTTSLRLALERIDPQTPARQA